MSRILWLLSLAWLLAPSPATAQTDSIKGRPVSVQIEIKVERDKAGRSRRSITDKLEWDVGVGYQVLPDIAVCIKVEGRDQFCTPGFDPGAKGDVPQRAECPDRTECRVTFHRMPYEQSFTITIYDVDLKDHDIIGRGTCTVGQGFCSVGRASLRMNVTGGAPTQCERDERTMRSLLGQVATWRLAMDERPMHVEQARREWPSREPAVISSVLQAVKDLLGKDASRYPDALLAEFAERLVTGARTHLAAENRGRHFMATARLDLAQASQHAFDEAEKMDTLRALARRVARGGLYEFVRAMEGVLMREHDLIRLVVVADDDERVVRELVTWRANIEKYAGAALQRVAHLNCAWTPDLSAEFDRALKEADRR